MISFLFIANRALSATSSAMSQAIISNGPRPLVLCGPSGSGKSTLLKRLFAEFPDKFGFSVSHTTRRPREGEQDAVHYYFVSRSDMEKAIANDEFIETAEFTGNMYGTSKMAVRDIQKQGRVCILDIEQKGVEQIKRTDLNPILIFNNPPSIDELERRLRQRGSETEETLRNRLNAAEVEIAYGLEPGNFHKIINNVDIDVAYEEFRDFVVAELKEQEAQGVHFN
ncbi:guanylate kinase [Drosophila sulfurigaster albostrigata]|uniref:guanylate kinase n=1 Tax=Drosophila albomicans TaxID=7291 RepID=A0A6P8WR12_DROAB|nr:guanylate kinase [Drosophila albomicans]XP_062135724.1 guanylate kinase [Drosophila sulfurigaster albostrigata]